MHYSIATWCLKLFVIAIFITGKNSLFCLNSIKYLTIPFEDPQRSPLVDSCWTDRPNGVPYFDYPYSFLYSLQLFERVTVTR